MSDAVAEVDQVTHENELKTMARIFADVKTTDKVIETRIKTVDFEAAFSFWSQTRTGRRRLALALSQPLARWW